MGLLEIVFVILLVLKLTGIITVSWWIVFSPLFIAIVIWVLAFISFVKMHKKF